MRANFIVATCKRVRLWAALLCLGAALNAGRGGAARAARSVPVAAE
jgi:hypothetical protein